VSPQPSARLYVTVATGVVVSVSGLVLLFLKLFVWRTDDALAIGKVAVLAMLVVSAVPLVLRVVHRAGGGGPERGARWVWDVALVVVAAVVLLLVGLSSPPGEVEGCGFDGKQCWKEGNISPAQPDGAGDDSPPSTPPLTR
jgi:hypothetical protein